MATFKPADSDVEEMVAKVLRDCYPQLHALTGKEEKFPLTFNLLMAYADRDGNNEPVGSPLHHHGRTAAAVISAIPKRQRACGMADVLIIFDGDWWEGENMTAERQEALVDHELYHLELVTEEGVPKRDDLGRLRFRMRAHDYEFGWFMEVAARRGEHSGEVTQARQMAKAHGQILFNFTDSLPGMPSPTVKLPTSTGGEQAKAHGFNVVNGGLSEIPEGNFTWEAMDAVQREAAQDAFQDRLDITASFRFEGVRCAGMFILGKGELAAYARGDDMGGAGDFPGGHPPKANEKEAKPAKKKAASGRKAAAKN